MPGVHVKVISTSVVYYTPPSAFQIFTNWDPGGQCEGNLGEVQQFPVWIITGTEPRQSGASDLGDHGLSSPNPGPLEKGEVRTPGFWPGEFRGLYSPRGRKESDTTEPLSLSPIVTPTQPGNSQRPSGGLDFHGA